MTKRIIKFFLFLLAGLILLYIGYQVYMVLYPSYKTSVAMLSTVDDHIDTVGIAVRNEALVDSVAIEGEVLHYLVRNGDKVARGSNVAEVYATMPEALDNLRLEQIDSEIAVLQSVAEQGRSSGTNVDSLYDRVYRMMRQISVASSRGNRADIIELRVELQELLNSIASVSGNPQSIETRIAELEAEVEGLGNNTAPIGFLTTQAEGYFVSSSDGFETVINKENVLEMPVADIIALVESGQTDENAAQSKIVSDYVWYFAAVIDASDVERFKEGMHLTLDFNFASVTSLPTQVVAVRSDETSNQAVVVLSCDVLNTSISGLRCEEVIISFRNYNGFRVDRSALHMENGVLGVYIKYGSKVEFRELNIIYETQDYVVSAPDTSNSKLLALYDEIIVAGKDLHVGKELR